MGSHDGSPLKLVRFHGPSTFCDWCQCSYHIYTTSNEQFLKNVKFIYHPVLCIMNDVLQTQLVICYVGCTKCNSEML